MDHTRFLAVVRAYVNGNGMGDADEDANGDGNFDAVDCQGSPGTAGETCESDADGFDGLFCNGAESCTDGVCSAGPLPCDTSTERRPEDSDECVAEPGAGQSAGEPQPPTGALCGSMGSGCTPIGSALILTLLGLLGLRLLGPHRR